VRVRSWTVYRLRAFGILASPGTNMQVCLQHRSIPVEVLTVIAVIPISIALAVLPQFGILKVILCADPTE